MAKPKVNTTTQVIQQINQYCKDGKWFWVAGLARETWQALLPVMDQLHEIAQQAVEHYADEAAA